MGKRRVLTLIAVLLLALPTVGLATNGMNLEGYGPIAGGMGGASLAYDNRTAATMNNPATIALMSEGLHLDVALGKLGPSVDATVQTPTGSTLAESSGNAYYMPALGFMVRRGDLGFGLGIFGQGGMGTDYSTSAWLADPSMGANTALTTGLVNRSEVSVGRAITPFTYNISEKLSLGVTADFVWAGMDVQMAMSEAQFQDLANPQSQVAGRASGSLANAFGMMYEPFGGTGIQRLYHAYFDFSNDSDFTGAAKGYGIAAKLGAVYRPLPTLSFGATYHTKTSLSDLEATDAELSMGINVDPGIFQGAPTGNYMDMIVPVSGEITVRDFEWPAMYGAGIAYRPVPRVMLALDVHRIAWSDVMDDFRMTFKADDTPENGGFAGLELDAVLFQGWEDQTVIALGGAVDVTDQFTLRAGFNGAKNPVPSKYLNALFPAIVENHITFGGGYLFGTGSLDMSMAFALETDDTNPGNGTTIPPVKSTHSQFNWMLMYGHRF